MTDEVTRIVAELRKRTIWLRRNTRAFDPANVATEFAAALDALALALENGGGCRCCHGDPGEMLHCPSPCPCCDDTGIGSAMRRLLEQLGVLEVQHG